MNTLWAVALLVNVAPQDGDPARERWERLRFEAVGDVLAVTILGGSGSSSGAR